MSFLPPLKQHLSRLKAVELSFLILTGLTLGACSIYKAPVTQGNIVTTEQVSLLKIGMTRQQVQQTLGSPLLQDVFNSNRWDYIYRVSKSNGLLEQRSMTVTFDGDGKLVNWSGQVAPNQNDTILKTEQPTLLFNQANFSPTAEPEVKLNAPLVVLAKTMVPDVKSTTENVKLSAIKNDGASSSMAKAATTAVNSVPASLKSNPIVPEIAVQAVNQPLRPSDFQLLVEKKINQWRAAWQTKDIAAYASHYTAGYAGDFPSHAAWLADRQRIISDATNLSITLSDIKVIQTSHTEARAAFTQLYQSTQYSETGSKNLFFQRDGSRWLIVAERFIKQS